MQFHNRLKVERERLGFNQEDFAGLVGATRKSQFNWETGLSSPNADTLSKWATVGLDVNYVFTGQRSLASPTCLVVESGDPAAAARVDGDSLKDQVAAAANALTREGKKPTILAVRGRLKAASSESVSKHLVAWREQHNTDRNPVINVAAKIFNVAADAYVEGLDRHIFERHNEAVRRRQNRQPSIEEIDALREALVRSEQARIAVEKKLAAIEAAFSNK